MHMIPAQLGFYYFYTFSLTQLTQYLSYVYSQSTIYYLPPIFRCKYYMVLTFPLGMC